MSIIQYLLESAFCLACLYAVYWLALRRETFFQWNRLYLVLAPLTACSLPALHWQLTPGLPPAPATAVPPVFDLPALVDQAQAGPRALRYALEKPVWSLTLGQILWWIYLAVAGIFLVQLLIQVLRLLRFIGRCRRVAGAGRVLTEVPAGTPLASFFGFVFWNPGDAAGSEQRMLFEHEMVHVRQWHSLDLILMQVLIALQWFNPLLYAYRRSLRTVHEYIADDYVVRRTRQRYAYASLLARCQATGHRAGPGLLNTFHSLIKKRLTMMAKPPSHPARRLKYLLLLPAYAALMLLFSFRLAERLPATAAAMRSAEYYAARLSQITVSAKAISRAGPSPFILFWGTFQAGFEYLPATGRYLAEIHISPEELQEAIQREPRLWNGQSLEQRLSMEINGRVFASDYNNPELYRQKQGELSAALAALQPSGFIGIEQIEMPGGKWGALHIFLDGNKPGWIPPAPAQPAAPAFKYSVWENERFMPGESRFMTEAQFWNLLLATPSVVHNNGSAQIPQKWSAAVFNASGVVLRPPASAAGALSLDQLRERLQALKTQIEPGVKIILYAWDLSPLPEGESIDTVITFDPITYQEHVSIVRNDGLTRQISHALASIKMLPPNDPRLLLRGEDTRSFRLECGLYSADLINLYAISFAGDQPERLFADSRSSQTSFKYTRSEILQMLRTPLRFYRENEALADWNITIDYKGYGTLVKNGAVPPDLLSQLERELRPGDVLRFNGLQARRGGQVLIAMHKALYDAMSNAFSQYKTGEIQTQEDLVGLTVSADVSQRLHAQLGERPGLYWQYGEIDLSTATIELEVRSDDPKPPLTASPAVQPQSGIRLQASPNPAREAATVDISLPKDGQGLFTLTNAAGVVCFTLKTDFHSGHTLLKLPLKQIKASGMLYIRLEMPYASASTALEISN